jgi:hypothetical protein
MAVKLREKKSNLPDGTTTIGPIYVGTQKKVDFFTACAKLGISMEKGIKMGMDMIIEKAATATPVDPP